MKRLFRVLLLLVSAGYLSACQMLPPVPPRPNVVHLPAAPDSALARAVAPLAQAHPHKSGIYPIASGNGAFAARAALARSAQHSLDLQYYIWRQDNSGQQLLAEVLKAARRGVRVRLLLDDNNTPGMDALLAALDQEPNIQVRLFNPFVYRRARLWDLSRDFKRLNRRMHNKSWTADNTVSIIGGRNIGDEYFSGDSDNQFMDMDAVVVGAAVEEISQDFDRYWNSASAYEAHTLLPRVAAPADAFLNPPKATSRTRSARYRRLSTDNAFQGALLARQLPFHWAHAEYISDDPARALDRENPKRPTALRLDELIGHPRHSLLVVTPYFVPTRDGVAALNGLSAQGVTVTVLTNSLASTDVAAVHSGYAKYRRPLLAGGVALYELKHTDIGRPVRNRGWFGHGGSSLHAKMFAVDDRALYIGSFNFDPRSARLNTESGLWIASPALTHAVAAPILAQLGDNSYRLSLTPTQQLQWTTRDRGKTVTYRHDPETTRLKRFWVGVLSLLPIDSLL